MNYEPHPNNTTLTYGRVFRQVFGMLCILGLTALAQVLTWLPLSAQHTLAVGYGAGLAFFIPGVPLALHGRVPGITLLGGGMAFLFLSTVHVLFRLLPQTFLFHLPLHPTSSLLLCLGLLVLFGTLAWRTWSQTNSVLTLALGIYLLFEAMPDISVVVRIVCLLAGVSGTIVWFWCWTKYRRGVLFPLVALLLVYAALFYFLRGQATHENALIAVGVAILFFTYILATTLVAGQSFRRTQVASGLYLFAVENTLLFAAVSVALLARADTDLFWLVPAAIATVSACAIAVLCLGNTPGKLLSLFMVQASLGLVLVIVTPLSSGPRFATLAGLCMAPAMMGRWRSDPLLRALEYALVAIVLTASFFISTPVRYVFIGPVGMPLFWAYLLGAAALLFFMARLHEHWAGAHQGNWHSDHEMASLIYACAAALMITLHVILQRGDSEALPHVLSLHGLLYMGMGMATLSKILVLAGFVPVIAAQACFYIYPTFSTVSASSAAVISPHLYGLFAVSLMLALAADYLLGKRLPPETGQAHLLCFIPYLPLVPLLLNAGALLPLLYFPALAIPPALLMLWTSRLKWRTLPGFSKAGYLLAGIAPAVYIYALYTLPAYRFVLHLPFTALYLISLVFMERITLSHGIMNVRTQRVTLCLFLFGLTLTGVASLYAWNSGPILALALLALAVFMGLMGLFFNATRYLYVGATLVLGAMLHFLLYSGFMAAATPAILSTGAGMP